MCDAECINGLLGEAFRFYATEGVNLCTAIDNWLTKESNDFEVSDKGGVLDEVYVDNTPMEKTFEDRGYN